MHAKVIMIFILAICFNALANILIKTSSLHDKNEQGLESVIYSVFNPYFIGGLASFGLALVGYRFVLGKGLKLSLAYPVFTSSGFIIVLIASAIFFKERLSLYQWLGITLIIVGVWLTAAQMFDVEG